MLRAVFQEAPVPLFLLERDGTVRRVNNRASDLIGSRPAYAAGKPFTLFVDLPSRAAVQTYLAAAARTSQARQTECALLSDDGVVHVRLTVEPISLPEDTGVLLIAASADGPPAPQTAGSQTAGSQTAGSPTAGSDGASPGRDPRHGGPPGGCGPGREARACSRGEARPAPDARAGGANPAIPPMSVPCRPWRGAWTC